MFNEESAIPIAICDFTRYVKRPVMFNETSAAVFFFNIAITLNPQQSVTFIVLSLLCHIDTIVMSANVATLALHCNNVTTLQHNPPNV